MIQLKRFEFNFFAEHCYLAWDENDAGKAEKPCLIVDPGCQSAEENEKLRAFMKKEGLQPLAILLTHAHPDHCFGVPGLCRDYGIKVYMNPGERVTLDAMHKLCIGMGADDIEDFSEWTLPAMDGDRYELGPFDVRVLGTPGHSAGGVCYLCGNVLFSGDTLFAGCIGRSDLPGGDYDALIGSILTKLMPLPGDVDVLPGHGHSTTIADERSKNPFLMPYNEPYEEDE